MGALKVNIGTDAAPIWQAVGGSVSDTEWVDFSSSVLNAPAAADGNVYFTGAASVTTALYRRVGGVVHVKFNRNMVSTLSRDFSGSVTGDFQNTPMAGAGSVPAIACPDYGLLAASARAENDTQVQVALNPDGSITWTGGFSRNYPASSGFTCDWIFVSG